MNLGTTAAIGYGILTLIGGIMGYVKAKSQASLISGLVSGSLLIFAGTAQLMGQSWGLILAAAISAALVIVFILRLVKTRKFMPAGLLILASLASLGAIAYEISGQFQ
ncbi:MAG: TMEM14 family protein [Microcoleus sp.]